MEQETFCNCLPILISGSSIFTTKYLDPKITVPTSKFCNTGFIFTCPLWSTPSEIKGFWDSLFHLTERGKSLHWSCTFSQETAHFEANLPVILTFCTLVHIAECTHSCMNPEEHSKVPIVTPLLLKAVRPQDQTKFSLKQNFTESKHGTGSRSSAVIILI